MRRTAVFGLAGLAACATALAGNAHADAAGFDDTYGVGGTVFTPITQDLGSRYRAAAQAPGGGTYAVGSATVAGTDQAVLVSRTNADGDLVGTFGTGGMKLINLTTGPFDSTITASAGNLELATGVAVQPDGRILVTAQSETPQAGAGNPGAPTTPGVVDFRDRDVYVLRVLPNGDLDTSFSPGTTDGAPAGIARLALSNGRLTGSTAVLSDQTYAIGVQPDSKIVVSVSKGTDTSET